QWLREKRRYMAVVVIVIAAVLTPPDVISQLSLAIPTYLLYELSILSVGFLERRAKAQEETDKAAEAPAAGE
ncbi:MAG: twin-arginine translocase subunit TatC, partial [Beijerinckiaceae bacterium]